MLFVRNRNAALFRHPKMHVVIAASAINGKVGIIGPCNSDLPLLNYSKNEIIWTVIFFARSV